MINRYHTKMNLGDFGGITHSVIHYSSFRPLFKPFTSKSDAFFRAATIATGPLAFSILAIYVAMILSMRTFLNLIMYRPMRLVEDFTRLPFIIFKLCLSAIVSPFINTVDLIGGGIATLMMDNQVENLDIPSAQPSM